MGTGSTAKPTSGTTTRLDPTERRLLRAREPSSISQACRLGRPLRLEDDKCQDWIEPGDACGAVEGKSRTAKLDKRERTG